MFHWFGVVQNTRGDALSGWQVGLVDLVGNGVPIFADENGTAIETVSGVADRAVADENGNYDFFVPNGDYTLQFFNPSGVFQRSQRFVAMWGNPAVTAVTPVAGTAYTLALSDASSVLTFNNASNITLTIPAESTANFPVGTGIELVQLGNGQIIPTAAGGVTIIREGSFTRTRGVNAMAGIRKIASNTWIFGGALA